MGESFSSSQIKDLYRFFNGRYFRGRLPDIPVVWCPDKKMPKAIATTWIEGEKPVRICMNYKYKDTKVIWYHYLLHEMVHVQQAKLPRDQAHGRKFQKRMKQLANAGAFNCTW
jgi:hypothetical protein